MTQFIIIHNMWCRVMVYTVLFSNGIITCRPYSLNISVSGIAKRIGFMVF